MAEKHPFEKIFEQISDLLKFTENNKKRLFSPQEKQPVLTPEIEEKLRAAKEAVERFKKATDLAMQQSNLDADTIEKNIRVVPDRYKISDRRVIEKAKKLRKEVETIEKDYALWISLTKMQRKKGKTAGKKRKKKFKRLGGQGWMPM